MGIRSEIDEKLSDYLSCRILFDNNIAKALLGIPHLSSNYVVSQYKEQEHIKQNKQWKIEYPQNQRYHTLANLKYRYEPFQSRIPKTKYPI